jgi:hypothetical protein
MNICHRAFSDSDCAGCATRVRQRYRPLAISTRVQNPVFTADPTLEGRGTGALGDPDSEALSSSAANWSGSALSPRMRKNPAMVAERKMRMTRSGHISSPRKQSMNESLGGRNWIQEKGGGFGFIAGCGALGMGREEDQWRIRGSWIGTWVWVGAADPPWRDGFLPETRPTGRARAHLTPPLATWL